MEEEEFISEFNEIMYIIFIYGQLSMKLLTYCTKNNLKRKEGAFSESLALMYNVSLNTKYE
ncbi:hypothetical protein [Clostridium beijerinckii]|uniref:hypothetical protein n=1 Tax=Clostridium beijerinckii TaxID=1520 RepID=UPI00156DBCE0|nr:hypothetical protein [Clostridium beijerinckii]NRW03764.1 hypothetical protein [Clostridium beijerinckii]NRW29022.1 hypothetical protein [Clostridium beijerinckii]NRW70085.1 hypothetical protein [Clostridium beijerinckii]NRY53070.1 hypothetical protein [Clostridium beijerinckii]NSA20929.1 hypothetical protein [Clostridium beijerinckii]